MNMTQRNASNTPALMAWRFGIRSLHTTSDKLYAHTIIAATEAEAIQKLGGGYECFYAGHRPVREGDK